MTGRAVDAMRPALDTPFAGRPVASAAPARSHEAEGFVVEGYACLFGVTDLGRDMVMPGAFADSLAQMGAGGVRMLYQHDPAQPIGVWTHLLEDAHGLYVRGLLSPRVARARECAALVEEGALDGLSIGFKAVKARTDPRSRVRRVERIELWEIFIVTFPMQPGARIARPAGGQTPSGGGCDGLSPALALASATARLRASMTGRP